MEQNTDAANRMVIPKEIRRQVGLRNGGAVDVQSDDSPIEIEPFPTPVKLIQQGPLLVAKAQPDLPLLSCETVEQTLDALRQERSRSG